MTTDEFNQAIERFEISMLGMTPDERFEALYHLTQDRYRLTRQIYAVTDLMIILYQLTDDYVHVSLCRAISNLLYLYDN